jgi:hypothetical protein
VMRRPSAALRRPLCTWWWQEWEGQGFCGSWPHREASASRGWTEACVDTQSLHTNHSDGCTKQQERGARWRRRPAACGDCKQWCTMRHNKQNTGQSEGSTHPNRSLISPSFWLLRALRGVV